MYIYIYIYIYTLISCTYIYIHIMPGAQGLPLTPAPPGRTASPSAARPPYIYREREKEIYKDI